jgi:hypothetical protein
VQPTPPTLIAGVALVQALLLLGLSYRGAQRGTGLVADGQALSGGD